MSCGSVYPCSLAAESYCDSCFGFGVSPYLLFPFSLSNCTHTGLTVLFGLFLTCMCQHSGRELHEEYNSYNVL